MGQAVKFDYFYGAQADQYSFYRIPKVLFTNECFRTLSCEAKVLYGLMLDRIGLSIKNRWIDDENRVYIIYTIEEIMKHLNCGNKKAVGLVAELDSKKGIGLIEKKRLGLGKANIIYVKNFTLIGEQSSSQQEITEEKQGVNPGHIQKCQNDTSENVPSTHLEMFGEECQKCQNDTSGNVPVTHQEMSREHGNNTDFSNTDLNDNYPSILSIQKGGEEMDEVAIYREIVRENIEYECLINERRREEIDELVDLMVEVICTTGTKIKVGGTEYPIQLVKSKFLKVLSFRKM